MANNTETYIFCCRL